MELCVTHVVKPGSHWYLGRWMWGSEGGRGLWAQDVHPEAPYPQFSNTSGNTHSKSHLCMQYKSYEMIILLFAKHSNISYSILFF